tara:strand:- start:1375 stop:1758 length:384 start_codon:yes stop_codon:yes gene_type:complete
MNNFFWLLLLVVWLGFIIYINFFNPLIEDNAEPCLKNRDKLGHCVFYALLSLFLSKTFTQEIITQNPLFSRAKVSLIFGFLIGLGQHFFTYDHYVTFLDVLANALGILLVVVMIYFYPKLLRFNSKI